MNKKIHPNGFCKLTDNEWLRNEIILSIISGQSDKKEKARFMRHKKICSGCNMAYNFHLNTKDLDFKKLISTTIAR